jgi:hypothetical protein
MNKRPIGFTILSFIGVYHVIGHVITLAGFRFVEWHLFNYILCILTLAITVVLIYGLWCVKKWTLKAFITWGIASMLNMIFNFWADTMGYTTSSLVICTFISLWALFIFFLVGRYINRRLEERYPVKSP